MRRRRLLAYCGVGIAGLTGCVIGVDNRGGGGTDTRTTVTEATETTARTTTTATWTHTDGVYGAGTAECTLRGAGDGDHVTTAEVASAE